MIMKDVGGSVCVFGAYKCLIKYQYIRIQMPVRKGIIRVDLVTA